MDKGQQLNQDSELLKSKSPVIHLLLAGALLGILLQLTGLLIKYFDHLSILDNVIRLATIDKNFVILGLIIILYMILWMIEVKWLRDGYKLLQKWYSPTTESAETSTLVGGYNSNWQTMQNPFFQGKGQNSHPSISIQKNIDKP